LKVVTSKQFRDVTTQRHVAPKWSAVERMSVRDISAPQISSTVDKVVKMHTISCLTGSAAPSASQLQREHPVSGDVAAYGLAASSFWGLLSQFLSLCLSID